MPVYGIWNSRLAFDLWAWTRVVLTIEGSQLINWTFLASVFVLGRHEGIGFSLIMSSYVILQKQESRILGLQLHALSL